MTLPFNIRYNIQNFILLIFVKQTVYVGLSGGVDSAMTAYILKQQGYEVIGVFIQNWDGLEQECGLRQDLSDARQVADYLQIPFKKVDFIRQYRQLVFDHFLLELEKGNTPNPDIFCNKYIKFKAFYEWSLSQGADKVATGHYATIDHHGRLFCGLDKKKDQTYFLYAIEKEHLKNIIFPLGNLLKSQIREQAATLGLPVSTKKDSTGICFIGPKNFRQFISQYIPQNSGDIVTKDGQVVGRHQGLAFYTLGQRSGLNIGGVKKCCDMPWYVVAKNSQLNHLVVSQLKDDPVLMSDSMTCSHFHWLVDPLLAPFKAQCRIRHGQEKQPCWIYPDKDNNGQVSVRFSSPQRAVTPGQAAVFYSQELCLGGATITGA